MAKHVSELNQATEELQDASILNPSKLKRSRTSMRIEQKGLLLIVVPLVCQLAFLLGVFALLREAKRDVDRQIFSKQLVIDTTLIAAREVTLYEMTLQLAKQRDYAIFTERFGKFRQQIEPVLVSLKERSKGNPARVKFLGAFDKEVRGLMNFIGKSAKEIDVIGVFAFEAEFSPILNKFINNTVTLLDKLSALEGEEQALQAQKSEDNRRNIELALACSAVITALASLAMAVGFHNAISSRLQVIYENTIRLSSKQELHSKLGGKDEISAIDSSFHAMSESLKSQERRLLATLDQLRIGVLVAEVATRDQSVEFANAEIAQLLEKSNQEICNHRLSEVLPSFLSAELIHELCLEQRNYRTNFSTPSGKTLTLEISARADDTSEQSRAIVCVRDVSKEVELERLKGQFVAMISHELRTPLLAVSLFLQLIQENIYARDYEALKTKSELQSRNVKRLIGLINELLDIEKIESENFDLFCEITEVQTLLADTSVAVAGLLEKNGVLLSTQVDPPDLTIYADKQRLTLVLVNLVSNAIKYSPSGSSVEVKVNSEDDWLGFYVIDKGRGIPADKTEVIFEKYKQVEAKDTVLGGTGLGLPICKAIINAHRGVIGVKSEFGRGSTFWFKMPAGVPSEGV